MFYKWGSTVYKGTVNLFAFFMNHVTEDRYERVVPIRLYNGTVKLSSGTNVDVFAFGDVS